MKKIIRTENALQATGPYSQAIDANGIVVVTGRIPLDPGTGHIVTGNIREQSRRVMEDRKATRRRARLRS